MNVLSALDANVTRCRSIQIRVKPLRLPGWHLRSLHHCPSSTTDRPKGGHLRTSHPVTMVSKLCDIHWRSKHKLTPKCLPRTGSTWSLNAATEQTPSLLSGQSPGPPPYSPASWAKNYPSQSEPAPGWQQQAAAPANLQEGQFIDSYALMHRTNHSPVNPTWDSNSPRASIDMSSWSGYQRSRPAQPLQSPAKPPLPVRPIQLCKAKFND